jgi:signal transduction histidine kinase
MRTEVAPAADLIGSGDESPMATLIARALSQGREQGRHDERLRLARDLHDGLGQTLTSAAFYARSLELGGCVPGASVAELRRLVEAALTDTRTIMWRLRPADVESLGFEGAMRALAETFRRSHRVRVDLCLAGVENLSPAIEAAAYRVAQEAMTNAVKHAEPAVLSVLAGRRGPTFRLVVDDDGTGFDSSGRVGTRGAGILGMRERAAALGGRLDLDSKPGHGTTVRLVLPCAGTSG